MSDCGDAFPIDLTGGELVFVDPYDDKEEVSIPNPAMRFVDEGTFRFMLRQFVGDDVETVGTVHPYPQVEKQRVVPVAVEMSYTTLVDGTFVEPEEGMRRNRRLLNRIAARSTDPGTQGLQTVNLYPHDGWSPDLAIECHVAVVRGAATTGKGERVGLTFTIPSPSTGITEL